MAPPKDSVPRSREEFAAAFAKIQLGATSAEVVSAVGKPDKVDGDLWLYGAAGSSAFPTLGHVRFGKNGRVAIKNPRSSVVLAPGLFDEQQLRDLLCFLNGAATTYGNDTRRNSIEIDMLKVIAIANRLQSLGKHKALAAVSEYLRVVPNNSTGPRGVSLALLLLLKVRDRKAFYPSFGFLATFPERPSDASRCPRYPLTVVGDLPLLLATRAKMLQGPCGPSRVLLAKLDADARFPFREGPLVLPANPLAKLDQAVRENSWFFSPSNMDSSRRASGLTFSESQSRKHVIMVQILQLVRTVFLGADLDQISDSDLDRAWKELVVEFSGLDARWNRERGIYTFADGSTIDRKRMRVEHVEHSEYRGSPRAQ